MKFLELNYENTSLDYRFIRAIWVHLNIKSEPGERKRCDPLGGPSIVMRLARQVPFNN